MAVSAFGTIYIQLDRGSYSPGQQVNGTIYLNVTQNYPGANELWLTITGMEDVKLIEQKHRTEHYHHGNERRTRTVSYYVHHHDYNSFFNHKFPVYRFNTPFLPTGQYTFPTSFILPKSLPSTFNYEFFKHGPCHGRVNYVMQASIGSPQMSSVPPIMCNQAFIVNQELLLSSGIQKREMEKKITSCCCIPKGHTKIVTYFEKNDYTPGEIAYMVTEVDNSKCKADIQEIKGIFQQTLRLNARGFTEMIMLNHQTICLKGIKAQETLLGEQAKRLQVTLRTHNGSLVQPTCRGKLVSNEYKLVNKLKMDAFLCCDHNPSCELQLNVRNAELHYEKWADQPSNWNPQVMGAYNAQFTSEYSENIYYPPQSLEYPNGGMSPQSPQTNQNTPHGVHQGYLPNPGKLIAQSPSPHHMERPSQNYPHTPGMPGMPGMPQGPGLGMAHPGMPTMPPTPGIPTNPATTGSNNYPIMPGMPEPHDQRGSEPGKPGMPNNVPTITENDFPARPADKPPK